MNEVFTAAAASFDITSCARAGEEIDAKVNDAINTVNTIRLNDIGQLLQKCK